jgi:hypothetical protein
MCNSPQPTHAVQVQYCAGPPMWYGYNVALANPCSMGTITLSANVSWPTWYGKCH